MMAGIVHTQFVTQVVNSVLEIVRRSHDIVSAVLLEQLGDPGPPASAADYPQIKL